MTDIFGTLGPGCLQEETLKKMFAEGMTGMRINLSHMMLSDNEDKIRMIRQAAKCVSVQPKILIDLQGPELRIGVLPETLALKENDVVTFRADGDNGNGSQAASNSPGGNIFSLKSGLFDSEKVIPLARNILSMLTEGEEFLMDDGKILARVITAASGSATARILRGGLLSSRKSITVESSRDSLPALTEADRINLKTAVRIGVTGVMQPFVRSKKDLNEVRSALLEAGGERIRIYAKIENMTGVNKLDELIDACDEIVIARGDLGNAMPLWELPGMQKKIAARCRQKGRDFMVVTQMLSSMEHAAVPTRAEVSDIYNAVADGANSVMVTGETAVGAYPVEVIRYLSRTAKEACKRAVIGQKGGQFVKVFYGSREELYGQVTALLLGVRAYFFQ